MAKCIRSIKSKDIHRVSDALAAGAVAKGLATYCSKGAWKKEVRDNG